MSPGKFLSAISLLIAGAATGDCRYPTETRVDVGVTVSQVAARASAQAYAEVVDPEGTVCWDFAVTATTTISQTVPAINYVQTMAGVGHVVANLDAPAQSGSCYYASIVGKSWAGSRSMSAGPACWLATTQPQPVRNPESPIILSLGGDGYRLTSAAAGVQFDIRNDGRPVQIAWTEPGSGNAFLALDRDGNGAIDSGAELFGNSTPLHAGGTAAHGFAALSELDGNGDGLVDDGDAAWSTLLLWTDIDHDGRSAPGELQPIAGSGVTALETGTRWVGRTDEWGNEFRYMAHYRVSQARRTYYDVFLQTR